MAVGKSKKQVLQAEKVYGLGGFATIPLTNIIDINPDTNGEDINIVCSSMGAKRNYKDDYHTTLSFNVETYLTGMIDSYDPGTGEEIHSNLDALFMASGMFSENPDTKTVLYGPSSSSSESATLKHYKEDLLRNITGALTSTTIAGTVGQPLTATFAISAYGDLVPTVDTIPTTGCEVSDLAIIDKITGVTIDGSTINMQSFSFTNNLELQDTYAVGVAQYDYTDFDPQIELVALKVKNSISEWTAFQNESIQEIEIIATTKDSGTEISISVPFGKLLNVQDGDDAGRQTVTRTYRAQNDSGDDNYTIAIVQP